MVNALSLRARSWRGDAVAVLCEADAHRKCGLAGAAAVAPGMKSAGIDIELTPPDRPARPNRPLLVDPREVPKRNLGSAEGRIALLHALAHIELNAVDLAFDMAIRFADEIEAAGLDKEAFVNDWFLVGKEEARHFALLTGRLQALGAAYGDLPAHGALWDSASRSVHGVLSRLVIAPLVLEARGLDVTPGMSRRLRLAGDEASALILDDIFEDEIGHVWTGARWFDAVCAARNLAPEAVFARLVHERFSAGLKPPFNKEARRRAGFPASYLGDWNKACDSQTRQREEVVKKVW